MIGKSLKQVFPGGAFIILLVVAVYLPALRGGFIWDDNAHLTENPCIVGPLGFKDIWTSRAAVYYPLVLTSFWAQHALWGLHPLPYHLVNIVMQGFCAVLLWRVLLSLNVRGAWLGAVLWALHPVQAESVAWITELKNTQSCLFYLLTILFFVKWRNASMDSDKQGRNASYALVMLCAVLAMLSKASTVMLPVVLGLCAWWLDGRWRWRTAVTLVPFFLISAAVSGWTIWEQKFHSGALGNEWNLSLAGRVVVAGKAIWFYLGRLLWPHPLMFIYPRWEIEASQAVSFLPFFAAVAALFILWCYRNGCARPVFFAYAYFVISLFPVLDFFDVYFFRYSYVGDHFQYLAGMGPLALAGAVLASAIDVFKKENQFLIPAICGALIAALSALTWQHTDIFRNNETLWRDTLVKNPDAWMAHDNLSVVLLKRGEINEAIAQCEAALQTKPDDAEALGNLGGALTFRKQYAEAIAYCQAALQIKPDYAEGRANLANALAEVGKIDEAIEQYRLTLQYNPNQAGVHNALGIALAKKGNIDEAIEHFRAALQSKPGDADTHDNWGTALAMQGKLDEAIEHYQKALQLNPSRSNTRMNYGSALATQQRYAEAVEQYGEVLRVAPGYAPAHKNLGMALVKLGQTNGAVVQFQEALRLDPSLVPAKQQLRALGVSVSE
jgi:Tfp pilus assembly protein PilF